MWVYDECTYAYLYTYRTLHDVDDKLIMQFYVSVCVVLPWNVQQLIIKWHEKSMYVAS